MKTISSRFLRLHFALALGALVFSLPAPAARAAESLIVTTTVDENNGTSDPTVGTGTSLREAINWANTDGVNSAITFNATAFAAPRKTIVLNGTSLPTLPNENLGKTLSITAPAAGVEISGNNASRIFYIDDGIVTLTGLTLRNGNAGGDVFGGALYNFGGILVMDSCTLTGNLATEGGAIAINSFFGGGFGPTTILRNCTITGNIAFGDGGGVSNLNGPTLIDSCTITQNIADWDVQFGGEGGGVHGGDPSGSGTFVRNSIIAANKNGANSGDDVAGSILSQGYNLIGTGSATGEFTATGDQVIGNGDPGLGPLAENGGRTRTHALLANSPARDMGNTDLTVDQRSISRPQGVVDDKGAFEFNSTSESLVVTTTADEDNGTSDPSFGAGTSLREAVNFANVYGGNNTITFSATAFAAPRKTITLGGTQLPAISGTLSITAPAAGVEISGNNASRVFDVVAGANVTLIGLTIRNGNSGGFNSGGGIRSLGTLLLDSCTFSGNTGANGGAIFSNTDLSGVTLTVRNCTLSGNSATGEGGGIDNRDGLIIVESSTIAGNSSGAGGAGVISWGDTSTTRTEVRNSIIAGNTGTDVGFSSGNGTNSFQSNGYNLIGDGNAVGDFNQISDVTGSSDPGLLALADNGGRTQTRALLPTSPARDTGNTTLTVDQRGITRPQHGIDDKGAFELMLNESLVVTTTADEDNTTSDPAYGAGTSLREAINFANSDSVNSAITFSPAVFAAPRKTITLGDALPILLSNGSLSITAPLAGVNISGSNATSVFTNGGNTTLTGLTIRDGNTNFRGGAIQNVGQLLADSCSFINNTAAVGGAISSQTNLGSATATIRNCTFTGNAANNGGALYNFSGQVVIESSTIAGNTAPANAGSGVASVGDSNTLTEVHNSIIAGNSNGDVDIVFGGTNSFQSDGYNLIGDGNATGEFVETGDQINTDPILGPLKDNGGPTFTHAPLSNSPAIDRGKDIGATGRDQRGSLRPVTYDGSIVPPTGGDRSDIGAVELVPGVTPDNAASWKTHGAAGPFPIPLPLSGAPGIECRRGGASNEYQVIINFAEAFTFTSADVTNGTGDVDTSNGNGTDQITLNLTGVTNIQTITIALFANSGDVGIRMGVLVGDVDSTRVVTIADTNSTKEQALKPVTATNFRTDVNVTGNITTADTNLVKGKALTRLD